jgi:aryl-alcohol dehydrogenase-like predicted oxidoreductase
MNNLSRRRFLKTGIAGAGMVAISPAGFSSPVMKDDNVVYRTLGKTGLRVPVISFGVMRSDNPGLCKAAYDKGIRLFDTANGYQDGNNETMLGNFFKDYGRESFYIATKVKPRANSNGKLDDTMTPEKFLESFNASLSRLQVDHVDILYVHDVSSTEILAFKPLLNVLLGLKDEGKLRFVGFSTHRNEPAVIGAAADWTSGT